MIFQLLLIILSSLYVLHLLAYFYYWHVQSNEAKKTLSKTTQYPFISIIIVARNEASTIKQCINHLITQDYPSNYFEIIFVDDFSEDKTLELVKNFEHPNIRCISLANILSKKHAETANKKRGISIAIQQASGTIIACSDADAQVPKNWLTQIQQRFENREIQFYSAPVLYINNDSILEKFQTADMYSMIGISAASIQMNQPYMCNGANLAYRKDAFDRVEGYKNIDHLATGDDVLLMHKIHQQYGKKSVYYHINEEAIVYTYAEKRLSDFIQQRTRWVSKSSYYSNIYIQTTLAFMYIYHVCLLISPFFIVYTQGNWNLYLLIFCTKTVIDSLFILLISKKLNKSFNIFLMPIFEFIYICYISIIGITASIGNYTWKNRRIKK